MTLLIKSVYYVILFVDLIISTECILCSGFLQIHRELQIEYFLIYFFSQKMWIIQYETYLRSNKMCSEFVIEVFVS